MRWRDQGGPRRPNRWNGRGLIGGVLVACAACSTGADHDEDRPLRAKPGPAPRTAHAETSPETAPEALVLPDRPISTAVIRRARYTAQRRLLRDDDPLQPDLPPLPEGPLPGPDQVQPPEEGEDYEGPLPGFFTPMEISPGDDPVAHLNRAFAALERGEADGPVHLAFYGASGTAADLWPGFIRAYLQARFGDAGPGLVSAAKPTRWYRHNDFVIRSSTRGWTKHNAYRRTSEEDPGWFGAMGLAMSSDLKGAWSQLEPKQSSPSAQGIEWYEVHYLKLPEGGSFRVKLDEKTVGVVHTGDGVGELAPGESPTWGRFRVDFEALGAKEGEHVLRLEVIGDGEVWLLGVDAGAARPGIVLDTLGVDGGKLANQLLWDEELWASHLTDRHPVMYMLAFGNNESVDEDEPISEYEANHRLILDRFQATLPEASCVMLGPGDFPKKDEETGELLPRPRLDELRDVQRKLAAEYGCGFIDALKIIGGERGKIAWYHAGLGRDDYLHLTRPGYLRFGMAIADALVQPYDVRAGAGSLPLEEPTGTQ